nr:subtilisin-like protease SBT4.15 [Ipomoea batatas]
MLSSNEFGIFGSRLNTAFSPLTSINENVDDTRTSYYNVLSGTSMSCLHDSAAAAAYVKSFHPNWSPAIIFDDYSADDCRNIGASGGVERRAQLPICLTEELEEEYGGGKHGGDVGKQGKVGRHVMLNHN